MEKNSRETLRKEYMDSTIRFKHLQMKQLFHGTAHNEFYVLMMINGGPIPEGEEGAGEIQMSDLVKKMHWSMPAVSRLLKSMEEKKLIERKTDPKDRRHTLIRIRPEGKELITELRNNVESFFDEVMQQMGDSDMRQLTELQNRMLDCMESILKEREQEDR